MASTSLTPRAKREIYKHVMNIAKLQYQVTTFGRFPVSTQQLYETLVPIEDRRLYEDLAKRYPSLIPTGRFLPIKMHESNYVTTPPIQLNMINGRYERATKPLQMQFTAGAVLYLTDIEYQMHGPMLTGMPMANCTFDGTSPMDVNVVQLITRDNPYFDVLHEWADQSALHGVAQRVVSTLVNHCLSVCDSTAQLAYMWPNGAKLLPWDKVSKLDKSKRRPKLNENSQKEFNIFMEWRQKLDSYLAECSMLVGTSTNSVGAYETHKVVSDRHSWSVVG